MYRPLNDDGTNGVDDDDDDGMDDVRDNPHDIEMVGMSIIGIEDTDNNSVALSNVSIDRDIAQSTGGSSDDLLGLDENSTVLAKLIILNRQSTPVIVSFFLGLGGNFINLLFAGRFINSHDRNQVFAGRMTA